MLRLTYGVPLKGDVVKPNTVVTAAGVRTLLFDDWINTYPFGDDLIAFHVETGVVVRLTDRAAAEDYIENVSRGARADSPPWTDGDGVRVF